MATTEMLIRKRLTTNEGIAARLARFDGEPAVFLQESPDDKAGGWEVAQYPRITFVIDTFSHAERDIMGTLAVDVVCAETGTPPEEVEPFVRQALTGVFFTPNPGETFSLKWKETEVFKSIVGEREALIIGMSIVFDIYAFPPTETSDPDPIAAINRFALDWDKRVTVIGKTELPEIYLPSRQNPAMYFRKANSAVDRQTNTVVWINADIAAHLFAPKLNDRAEWLEQFAQSLDLAGEVMLLDGSPMFVKNITENATADETTGQLKITVQYGLLRRPRYAHTMIKGNIR